MRFKRPTPPRDSEANLIPLINVVFLLLIFFMLAGRLAPQSDVALEPPRSDSTLGMDPTPFVILIDRTGEITVDGNRLGDEALAEQMTDALGDSPKRVQIKADASLDAMRLIDILNRLRAAGAEELDLLTLGRDR
jgi:biopolymer transport protein ExbD